MTSYQFPTVAAVRATLAECGVPPLEVYDAIKVQPPWQSAFKLGRLKQPGYDKVVALVGFFENTCPDLFAANVEKYKDQ